MTGDGPTSRRPASDVAIAGADIGVERIVARLLGIGTYGSVALLAIGTALMLVSGVQPLSAAPSFDPTRLADDVLHLRAAGFLWLGLIAVVATPAGRVLASLIGYARRGERLMAVVAALILAVIALSVALARGTAA
jgi:uncharacterized membrane protein